MSGMRRMCTKGIPTKTAGAIPTSLLQRSGCNISKEFACLRCSCMLCQWLTGGRMCPSPHQHMIWLEALEVLTDLWLRFCTPFDILKVSKVKGSINVARCPVLWNWMPPAWGKFVLDRRVWSTKPWSKMGNSNIMAGTFLNTSCCMFGSSDAVSVDRISSFFALAICVWRLPVQNLQSKAPRLVVLKLFRMHLQFWLFYSIFYYIVQSWCAFYSFSPKWTWEV